MPALITHHLFGEESIDRLPQGVITSDEERIAFILGNQGPDPFFFHILTPRVSDCTLLAQVMHRSRMSRQFACLRDGVSHLLPRDASLGRAFALGLLHQDVATYLASYDVRAGALFPFGLVMMAFAPVHGWRAV